MHVPIPKFVKNVANKKKDKDGGIRSGEHAETTPPGRLKGEREYSFTERRSDQNWDSQRVGHSGIKGAHFQHVCAFGRWFLGVGSGANS